MEENMLIGLFREAVEKEKIGAEKLYTLSYPTGIDCFDYRNGKIEDGNILLGLNGGKVSTFIGKPGTGKTTFAIQSAWNIVKNYKESNIIHMDFERSTSLSRLEGVLNVPKEALRKKYLLLNSEISTESLFKMVRSVAKIKEENRNNLMVSTGRFDENGEEIMELPPTVVLVDSWSTMTTETITDVSNTELGATNMSGAQTAKRNNEIIRALVPVLEKANILLFLIGHITTKIETGPIKSQAQINFLSQDESLSGGAAALYLADTLIKFKASTKLEEEKEFGVKGFTVQATLVKSRSNESGRTVDLIFEQKRGFNNLLTSFIKLKSLGLLRGNGRAYYYDFAPDVKFTQKTFTTKYHENEEFARLFDEASAEIFANEFLYEPELYSQSLTFEETDTKGILKGSDGNYYNENYEMIEVE